MLLLQGPLFQVDVSHFLLGPVPQCSEMLLLHFLSENHSRKKQVYVVISDSGWIQFQDVVSIQGHKFLKCCYFATMAPLKNIKDSKTEPKPSSGLDSTKHGNSDL